MFNIEEYKSYIVSKIAKLSTTKRSYTKNQIIDYCSQWEKTPAEFFNGHFRTVSRKLHDIFGDSIKNKPNSVSINFYFLYLYGYRICSNCKHIKTITDFGQSKNRVFNLNSRCKPCAVIQSSNYVADNRDKRNNSDARRRARLLNAEPLWLTAKQKADILHFYVEGWQLGLEVDHIVPLQGKNVCGLHVPWNLQLLDRSANASKNNKFDDWSDIC